MSTTTTKEISVGDIGARAAAHSDNERMALNVGPSHPTTHGVLRLMMGWMGMLLPNVILCLAIFTVGMKKSRRT